MRYANKSNAATRAQIVFLHEDVPRAAAAAATAERVSDAAAEQQRQTHQQLRPLLAPQRYFASSGVVATGPNASLQVVAMTRPGPKSQLQHESPCARVEYRLIASVSRDRNVTCVVQRNSKVSLLSIRRLVTV